MRLPVFRPEDTRPARARIRRLVVQAWALVRLPPRVQEFYLRALWTAWRRKDQYSFDVVARPEDLLEIIRLAGDADLAVELGTATAWTALALAVGRSSRRVVTYDPVERPERELYFSLVSAAVLERITFVHDVGRSGPRSSDSVDFLFVDGSHQREDTIITFRVWSEVMAPGAPIVFHDYLDPSYPGITEAIRELGLRGEQRAGMFVWRRPVSPAG